VVTVHHTALTLAGDDTWKTQDMSCPRSGIVIDISLKTELFHIRLKRIS